MPRHQNETQNTRLLLRGARAVLPDRVLERAQVLVEDGRIARIMEGDGIDDIDKSDALMHAPGATVLDLENLTLYPGFIDVHIHGAVGVDVSDADAAGLRHVADFLAAQGVTAWLPTLVPGPVEDYRRAARAVAQQMREDDAPAPKNAPAARALGLHYEGPFVNEKQCGALRTPYFRTYASASDLEELAVVEHERAVHMTTLAPEIEGGVELVGELERRGWITSIGHTRASVEILEQALAAGARHMTHFLNAMSPLHHREPGPIGWGLIKDEVSVDLIADGIHSDPLMLRLVLRCKGAERVTLISDAVAPAGLGDGDYRVWSETIRVSGGRTSNERGSIAGSVITMREAVRMALSLGFAETDIARLASLNPARLLKLDGEYGSLEEGKRADLVALAPDASVRLTIIGGQVVN